MKKRFTIIELLAVLAIIGIIVAIVIPNISNMRKEANIAAVHSNMRNIQTAVDMYSLDNRGDYPTLNKPTEFIPEPIDFTLLHPDFVRDLPDMDGIKYWIDFTGKVWASTVDSPRNLQYGDDFISWESSEGAEKYQVFELEGYQGVIGSAGGNTHLNLLDITTDTEFPREDGKTYIVNTIDPIGLESAPAGLGYVGFPTNYSVRETLSVYPVASISMTPNTDIRPNTTISWGYENSSHPDGLNIVEAEWENKHSTYSAGEQIVRLRVKDENGVWSEWVNKAFNVEEVTFTTATFTNAGAEGRFGPTQAKLDEAYNETELEGKVTSENGIQLWTVPHTGTYTIETKGSQGGGTYGGKGTIMRGDFELEEGQKLKIIVGQRGGPKNGYEGSNNNAASGGGGTFVALENNTPLIISGGGGGGGLSSRQSNSNATTSRNGQKSLRGRPGGTNGDEGSGSRDYEGGAGFYSSNFSNQSFVNGGKGGIYDPNRYTRYEGGADGGFGSGGATDALLSSRLGGGGGYSGGAGEYGSRSSTESVAAGGGGSYIHTDATSVATSDGRYDGSTSHNGSIQNLNSWNSGHGKVIITHVGN